MKYKNKVINIKDVLEYFDDNYEGCEEHTNEFVNSIINVGINDSVSAKLCYALRAWATAEAGDDAGYASEFILSILDQG